jgi:phosphohistidine phosphatase
MRRLLLLRHAKSGPHGISADLDRPLAPRGRQQAPRMGAYLAEQGLRPDLALVSHARRTRETWDLARPALGNVPARFDERIYEAPAQRLLAVVRETEPAIGTLVMVGHNPGFGDLASALVGSGKEDDLSRLTGNLPTAGLVVIDFPVEQWRDVSPGSGRIDRFVTPKMLGLAED